MHDAVRVGGPRAAGCLLDELEHTLGQERLADEIRQRTPGHVLHDEVGALLELTEIQDRDDVRVVERGDALGLGEETDEELRVLGELRGEELDGHRTVEADVTGTPHFGHAPASESVIELVPLSY